MFWLARARPYQHKRREPPGARVGIPARVGGGDRAGEGGAELSFGGGKGEAETRKTMRKKQSRSGQAPPKPSFVLRGANIFHGKKE